MALTHGWALRLALCGLLLALLSLAAAEARSGAEWLQQLINATQNGCSSGAATVELASSSGPAAVSQSLVDLQGLALPLFVPSGCTLRLVGVGDGLATVDFGMLDSAIMKQPLLFLESGSTLVLEHLEVKGAAAPSVGAVSLPTTLESLPGFLAVGAAPGAMIELLNSSVALFPGEWCTPQLAAAAAYGMEQAAVSGTAVADGSTIQMTDILIEVPISGSNTSSNSSGGVVKFRSDATNFTCLGVPGKKAPAAANLTDAAVQPVSTGPALMAALAALAAEQEPGAGVISLQQSIVLRPEDAAGYRLPMNISANRTLAIESGGGAMHSLDFGGTPLLLYLEPGSGLVLRNVNVSGTAHIGMFGVFANDQSEEQYDPAVQALPTHVDSSPLFPTINNGPNTRVEMTNVSILLHPSKLCTPELVQRQVEGFSKLLGASDRFRTSGTTATVVQLALPVPVTQTSTNTPIGMGQVEMNNVSMMCTLPSADADWQMEPRQRVANASQLLAALAAEAAVKTPGVGVVEITSDIVLDQSSTQGAALPFNVSRGHTLALVGGGTDGATIDLSDIERFLLLEPGATLVLVNMSLTGFGPIHSDGPEGRQWANGTRTSFDPFPLFPTINASPNSTFEMYNTSLTLRPSDQCTSDVLNSQIGLFKLLTGDPASVAVQDLTVVVNKFSAPTVPVYGDGSKPLGMMTVRAGGLNVTCLPFSSTSPAEASGSGAGSSGTAGSGGVPAYAWVLVGLAATAVVAGAATTALLVRRRRLRRARISEGPQKDPERGDQAPPGLPPGDTPAGALEDDGPAANTSNDLQDGLWRTRVGFVDGLVLGGVLGGGGYGRVYRGTWRGAKVAVKVVATHVSVGDIYDLTREPLLSMSLSHPNLLPTFKTCVVRLLPEPASSMPSSELTFSSSGGASEIGNIANLASSSNTRVVRSILDRNALVEVMPMTAVLQPGEYETWLVSEYADRGSLADAIKQQQFKSADAPGCDMATVLLCLLDVARGLEYLHSCSIVHGDLKKENVLLKSERRDRRGYVCKLGDFGLSRLLAEHQTHVDTGSYGTASIAAPELLSQGRLTKASDIYAFGILLWELVSCQQAFSDTPTLQILWLVAHQKWRPPVPEGCPPELADLMQRCWHDDPCVRPTANQVASDLLHFASTLVKQRSELAAQADGALVGQRPGSVPLARQQSDDAQQPEPAAPQAAGAPSGQRFGSAQQHSTNGSTAAIAGSLASSAGERELPSVGDANI